MKVNSISPITHHYKDFALLGLDTIWAAVLDERVDETLAKVISVTENLVRRDLNRRDLIDSCTYLYRKYGNARAVADETGLPYNDVRKYVKYDRLRPELRELYDEGGVDLSIVLRAQDAAEVMGGDVAVAAVALVEEMKPLTHAQQKKLADGLKDSPGKALVVQHTCIERFLKTWCKSPSSPSVLY